MNVSALALPLPAKRGDRPCWSAAKVNASSTKPGTVPASGMKLSSARMVAATLILDRNRAPRKALRDAQLMACWAFQRDITIVNCFFAAKKGKTADDLARKMGFDPATFAETLATWRAAKGEIWTRSQAADEIIPLEEGPFYAIDASVDAHAHVPDCLHDGRRPQGRPPGRFRASMAPFEGAMLPGAMPWAFAQPLRQRAILYRPSIPVAAPRDWKRT